MDFTKYAIGTLTVALLVSFGFNVLPDDTHFCRDREISYHCDSFTQYYSLPNGKCINDLGSNKVCRSGWEELLNKDNSKYKYYICSDGNCVCDNGDCISKE